MNPFFAPYRQLEVSIRGAPGKSPMFFRDLHMMGAVFLADLRRVHEALPAGLFRPLALPGGKGLVAVHCMEYRDTDVGPYNEVSLSIAVRRGWLPFMSLAQLVRSLQSQAFHAYVKALPVNTEVSLHGGLDFFNYPKYLADISFRDTATHRVCTVRDRESRDLILEFEGWKPRTRTSGSDIVSLWTYPVIGGRPHRAKMLVNQLEAGTAWLRRGAWLRFGPHERAEVFKRLELGRQAQYVYAPRCEAVLFEPEAL